jgi:hypothetical protein
LFADVLRGLIRAHLTTQVTTSPLGPIDRVFQNIVQQLLTYIVQQPRTVRNLLISVLHRKEAGCPDCRSPGIEVTTPAFLFILFS